MTSPVSFSAAPESPPPDTAQILSADNYAFLQQYIRCESGISLGADKQYLVKSRLAPLVRDERMESIDDLCRRLRQGPPEALRRKIIESMTTHETLFFRDPNVFDALRGDLLPSLIRERQSSQTLRIWCAACSSGQEPYSIAMMLSELGCASWNIHLFATDISTKILDRAATGRFLQIEVNRGLPASLLVKYFQRVGLDWQIKDEVRRMVRFAPLDLRWNMGGLGPFDLILCRNVLIYFEIETRRKILGGLRGTLQPGGFLLLGASETTWNLDDTWQRHTLRNTVFYRNPIPGVIQ